MIRILEQAPLTTRNGSAGDQVIVTGLVIVLALLLPTDALAQSRTFYDASGRVSGRSTTGRNGSTTFYDASGRVTGRTSTGSNGTTTIYDAGGRNVGTVTSQQKGEQRR